MKRHFPTEDGRNIVLDVPDPRPGESIYVVAGHKTGSVLLTKIIQDLTKAADVPAIPVESSVWQQGFATKDWPQSLHGLLDEDGYIFYSFRWLQKLPKLENFKSRKKIFLIRDPRDIAVSYYFSMASSHGLPKAGSSRETILALREEATQTSIDEFIQTGKAKHVLNNIGRFSAYLDDPTAVFFRYEEVIFSKREWVARIANELGIDVSQEVIHEIADRHDIVPEKEAPNQHIRSVHPGDYKNKLSEESVQAIRDAHPVFFKRYGYA